MEPFENLEVWKRSSRLCIELYRTVRNCREFTLRDQITRSALSVPSNIAEGYERDSRNEYLRHLRIAKGSCGELRTQLLIGKEVGWIDPAIADRFIAEAVEISKMIHGLVKKLSVRVDD